MGAEGELDYKHNDIEKNGLTSYQQYVGKTFPHWSTWAYALANNWRYVYSLFSTTEYILLSRKNCNLKFQFPIVAKSEIPFIATAFLSTEMAWNVACRSWKIYSEYLIKIFQKMFCSLIIRNFQRSMFPFELDASFNSRTKKKFGGSCGEHIYISPHNLSPMKVILYLYTTEWMNLKRKYLRRTEI